MPHNLHPLPTPEWDVVNVWNDPHMTITLHQDGFILAIYLAWTLGGLAIYLFGHGLAPRDRPLFALMCGPAAWIAGIWKWYHLSKLRNVTPPPLPKTIHTPVRVEIWRMPKPRN